MSDSSDALRATGVHELPRFGRFQATAELGAGAMATVYRAEDDVVGRPVAIKTLRSLHGLGVKERFVREARAIGAVQHPNILAIYDTGSEGEMPYLVMELAAGGTLKDRIKHGPATIATAREVGVQIARALAAAHAANILHRDVKPANILVAGDGTWKLADFGIAKLPDSTLTITGQFLGSPSYAAPESLRGGAFSPQSDVYALAATLYETLAGSPPHGDHDIQSLIRKLEQDPEPLHQRIAITTPDATALADAIMAGLARDPERRPTADVFADLLVRDRVGASVGASAGASAGTNVGASVGASAGASVGVGARIGEPAARVSTPVHIPAAPSSRRRKLALAAIVLAAILVAVVAIGRGTSSAPAASAASSTPGGDPTRPGAQLDPAGAADPERGNTDGTDSDRTDPERGDPGDPADPRDPNDPREPHHPGGPHDPPGPHDPAHADPNQPRVYDQNGNPVDDETARRILDEMHRQDHGNHDDRDNHDPEGPAGHAWGHHKHKGR